MIIKRVSEDFWRLELKAQDGRLIWYGPSRTEVRSKFNRWARDKKMNRISSHTPTPTRVDNHFAHLE